MLETKKKWSYKLMVADQLDRKYEVKSFDFRPPQSFFQIVNHNRGVFPGFGVFGKKLRNIFFPPRNFRSQVQKHNSFKNRANRLR